MTTKEYSILVADDEEEFRDVLSSLLSCADYIADTAMDGVTAINAVQTKLYHVVLCDVKMPKLDGVDVLKYIKANFPGIEVIMMTGFADVQIAVECMKLGAYDYLSKPVPREKLLTTVHRALERRQLALENVVMKNQLTRLRGTSDMVGESEAFTNVLQIAAKVAPTESTVLIQGAAGRTIPRGSALQDQCYYHRDTFVTREETGHPDSHRLVPSEQDENESQKGYLAKSC